MDKEAMGDEKIDVWEEYNAGGLYMPREDKLSNCLRNFNSIIDKVYFKKLITDALIEELNFVLGCLLDEFYPKDFSLQIQVGVIGQHYVIFPGNDYTRDNYFRKPTPEELQKHEENAN